jgi:hypothetical protein
MTFSPSPLQTLLLWRLLANEGGDFWKYVKPQESKDRNVLAAAGLVATEKRKESDAKGSRPILFVFLTEQGWNWAADHLDADFSQTSNATGPVLRAILSKLKLHLARSNTSLADFICPPKQTCLKSDIEMRDRVRQGYFQASGGRWNVRVRLADLRRALTDVPRDQLDQTLLAMERQEGLVLYPLDDPQEIHGEDEAAGLANTLGIRRHILCIER